MTSGSRDDDPPKRRKGRRLAPDDETLWHRVARSIAPLTRAKPRVPDVEVEPPEPAAPAPRRPGAKPRPKQADRPTSNAAPAAPGKAKARPVEPPRATLPRPPPVPQPALERRQSRRIAAGTIEIEARLDLHGLTQSAAYDRLLGFIQDAAASGLKTVLVITGKGGRRRFLDALDGGGWGQSNDDIGILRTSLPRWLGEAPLRALVIGYQNAAVQHGGDGAFYVQLRRRRQRQA